MHVNGIRYDVEFRGWVRPPQEEGSNVVELGEDNLRACFSKHMWDMQKGKVGIGDVYHTVEDLLEQEECLSCDKDRVAFPAELEQVVAALNSYKGSKDATPRPHSEHDGDHGFYPRMPEV